MMSSEPVHPEYQSLDARLQTFKDWPRHLPTRPEALCEAGFFYSSHGDRTICFYCDGALKDWKPTDVPWQEHAKHFDRCPFLIQVKGEEFIRNVAAATEQNLI